MASDDGKPLWGFENATEFLVEIERWKSKGFLHMGSGTFYEQEKIKRFRIVRNASGVVTIEDIPD